MSSRSLSRWIAVPAAAALAVASAGAANVSGAPNVASASKRGLELEDFDRLAAVDGVVCARDGSEILYSVQVSDADSDERRSTLWMTDFRGNDLELTEPSESASNPQFSPDGRYVSFLASRSGDRKPQVYVLDRRGGEPRAVTAVEGDIADYAWSPDSRRLVVSLSAGAGGGKVPPPIVIDRLHFKQDETGYLSDATRTSLALIDVTTRELTPLTREPQVDDTLPAWSPDGKTIAFLSTRGTDTDRSGELGLYLIEVGSRQAPRRLLEFYAPNKPALAWTPDGARLVFTSGLQPRLNAYIQDRLNVLTVADGTVLALTASLDRAVSSPAIAADGRTVDAILEDDGNEIPISVSLRSGRIERRLGGRLSVTSLCAGAGRVAVVASTDDTVPEVYALEGGALRKITAHNDALLARLSLGPVEDIGFPSRDGTLIHAMMVKPADFQTGRTYPTIVWIHGGPNGQDSHGLPIDAYSPTFERQWLAAHGYVVLGVNYRGSSGRGAAFARAILADWGHKEVEDLQAAVDYTVRRHIADPHRLGVGGWSYGGILTDYLIATDARFAAAIAGAGSANQLSMYGSDEYELQYNAELGPPWAAAHRWLELSYPFFHADRIKTPTLFMGGDADFNVPIAGGEQMYQALRTLGVATQLIVYPGQHHLLSRPSYIRDRLRRYVEWFDRYLGGPQTSAGNASQPAVRP